jgi:hypothetical protein
MVRTLIVPVIGSSEGAVDGAYERTLVTPSPFDRRCAAGIDEGIEACASFGRQCIDVTGEVAATTVSSLAAECTENLVSLSPIGKQRAANPSTTDAPMSPRTPTTFMFSVLPACGMSR